MKRKWHKNYAGFCIYFNSVPWEWPQGDNALLQSLLQEQQIAQLTPLSPVISLKPQNPIPRKMNTFTEVSFSLFFALFSLYIQSAPHPPYLFCPILPAQCICVACVKLPNSVALVYSAHASTFRLVCVSLS